MRIRVIFRVLAFFVLLVIASNGADAGFDAKLFESDKASLILGMDLSDEFNIRFGLIIRDEEASSPERKHTVLTFPTIKVEGNAELFSTWGSYDNLTYLNYVLPGLSGKYYSVEMFPSIARAKDIDEIERSSSSISLITNGQTRTLIYRYPQNEGKDKLQEFITKDSMDIEMIAILLPEDATPIEVRSGRTSDPPEIFSKNRVGFYPARGQESSRQLRLSYWVPSTEGQKSFTELIAKISGALFVPLITVLLANRPNAALIRRRRWIIFGGLFLQGLALLAIVYLSYRSQGELLISNLTEVLVGVAAGLGTVALWWTGEKIPTA